MEMGNELQIKYIVYLTLNNVNNKIYIGIHKTKDPYKFDGYLGNGVDIHDRASYFKPKTPFQYAVKKYGPKNFIRKTIKVCDTLEQAKFWETCLVDQEFLNRADTYNVALGGGYPPPCSKVIYQYTLSGEFIQQWSSIIEASICFNCSSASIGKAVLNKTPSVGYLWTDIKYDFVDVETFKINANKLVTYLYDNNGNYLQEFESVTKCAEFLDVKADKISTGARGKYKVNNHYVSFIKYDVYPLPKKINHKTDKLYQYGMDGKFIKEWENYSQVKLFFNKNLNIHSSIKLGNTCAGFQWSWTKVPNMKNLIKSPLSKQKRKVGKYSLKGELIEIFESVCAAKRDTCGAPGVLGKQRKTAGGFIWKYIE